MCQLLPSPRHLARVLLALLLPVGARAQLNYAIPYSFYTLAGNSSIGSADGTAARFNEPNGVAVDYADTLTANGVTYYTVYVADTMNDSIRKIAKVTREVTTIAGSPGYPGSADGGDAHFAKPAHLAIDSTGNLYVTDQFNYTVRKINRANLVTTFAGLAGAPGSVDGTGSAARFGVLAGVAFDPAGNLVVADSSNHTIRKITPSGVVSTIAGSAGNSGSADGTGSAARFNNPQGLQLDAAGNVYVADRGNHTIRKITPDGTVSTLAGLAGTSGSADGTGSTARFNSPGDVSVDTGGNVFVTDTNNQTIRKITPAGTVSTLAGAVLTNGATDGTGGTARFNNPQGIAVDASGGLYVADSGNQSIRSVTPAGVVATHTGLSGGALGSTDDTGGAARFRELYAAAVSPAGDIFLADRNNHTIRKVAANSVVTTFAGTAGLTGSNNGTGTGASFNQPSGVAFDAGGNLYVADTGNHTIRKITSAGAVTTFAGSPGAQGSADGSGSAARFSQPFGVAVDASGNVFVADLLNSTIRKITSAGVVTTLAGSPGARGNADGTGSAARFSEPRGVATDSVGNVYVADFGSFDVRKITPAGVVTTLAGLAGTPGDVDGSSTAARFGPLSNLAVDPAGNVFVADTANNLVRKITPGGTVTTVAGFAGLRGNHDGIGPEVTFDYPRGLALDATGILYVASGTALRKGQLPVAPTIITQPQNVTATMGGGVVLMSVIASGVPTPTYQWYFNGTVIPGGTVSSLFWDKNVRLIDAGDYTVVVSNGVGSVTSNKATLTVNAATSPTPSSSGGGGGGGGGAPSGWCILALISLAGIRQLRRSVRSGT